MKEKSGKIIYTVMVGLSMLAVSMAGAVLLPSSGEDYFSQEALAAVSIHAAESFFTENTGNAGDEDYAMIDLTDDAEDTDEAEDMDAAGDTADGEAENADDSTDAAPEVIEDTDNTETVTDNDNAADESETDETYDSPTGEEDLADEGGTSHFELDEEAQEKEKQEKEAVSEKVYTDPEWESVDESYLDDALFIGDSRTVGFGLYSQLDNITVYAQKGFQIYNAASKPIVEDEEEGQITVAEALKKHKGEFKKAYIMFGLNEMGWKDDDALDEYYYNLIDYVKETQPKSIIYLQSIIHVTLAKSTSNTTFTNERINARNEHLKKIAANEHIYYLDLNEVFTDETGSLQADAASDGIHLKSEYILVWKDYILNHAITTEAEKKAKKREEARAKKEAEKKAKQEKLEQDKQDLLDLLQEDD